MKGRNAFVGEGGMEGLMTLGHTLIAHSMEGLTRMAWILTRRLSK